MTGFHVIVQIVGRYWMIKVWQEAATPEAAIAAVQAKFDQATSLGYITGSFEAIGAEAVQ